MSSTSLVNDFHVKLVLRSWQTFPSKFYSTLFFTFSISYSRTWSAALCLISRMMYNGSGKLVFFTNLYEWSSLFWILPGNDKVSLFSWIHVIHSIYFYILFSIYILLSSSDFSHIDYYELRSIQGSGIFMSIR